MHMTGKKRQVKRRDEQFATRTATRIWQEVPSADNPYLAETCRCHGYDIRELARKRSFSDVLFLLFQGELPSPEQANILESLLILFINPGPRHPAVRAAMNAAVSRTHTQHLLPIGLSVMSGEHLGGSEVLAAMRFIETNLTKSAIKVAETIVHSSRPTEGDFHPVPGFGSRFGAIDPMSQQLATLISSMPGSGPAMAWCEALATELKTNGMGWLVTGVAAAAFHDLGFSPWAGAGLFQLACAPGILAHGLELADKPLTAMPFLDKDHYVITPAARI
jgi:citrate synthase